MAPTTSLSSYSGANASLLRTTATVSVSGAARRYVWCALLRQLNVSSLSGATTLFLLHPVLCYVCFPLFSSTYIGELLVLFRFHPNLETVLSGGFQWRRFLLRYLSQKIVFHVIIFIELQIKSMVCFKWVCLFIDFFFINAK